MTVTFRQAIRSGTSVLVAFAGGTGSGKTYSALRFARGLVGPKAPIAFIDTESGRALHYADEFEFDHYAMPAPFTATAYEEAIRAAAAARYGAVIVDSWSHTWAGEGGVTDQHDEALHDMVQRAMKKNPRADEYTLTKAMDGSAWRVKIPYKAMVQRLLQSTGHLVFCLRAEPKVKYVTKKDDDGRERTMIVDAGWQPICERMFMYEMTCSFMMDADRPGTWHPIKLPAKFTPFFPSGEVIGEKSGVMLAEWAAGTGHMKSPVAAQTAPASTPRDQALAEIKTTLAAYCGTDKTAMASVSKAVLGVSTWTEIAKLADAELLHALIREGDGGPTKLEAECLRHRERMEAR